MPSTVMEEGEKEDSDDNDKAVVVVLALRTLRITTEHEAHWQFSSGLWVQEG